MRRVTVHSQDPRGRPERTWAGEMLSAQPNASLAISADRRVDVTNSRVIPTIMVKAAENKVVRPDILTLDGRSASVITAGVVLKRSSPVRSR